MEIKFNTTTKQIWPYRELQNDVTTLLVCIVGHSGSEEVKAPLTLVLFLLFQPQPLILYLPFSFEPSGLFVVLRFGLRIKSIQWGMQN